MIPTSARERSECAAGCGPHVVDVFVLAGSRVQRCARCGLYRLHAAAALEREAYDRSKFDEAFRDLRQSGYGRILDALARLRRLDGVRVLDVGSSAGWFLRAARDRGCRVHGIEPDPFFFERAQRELGDTASLVCGYFDADVPPEWGTFDIITFHDVFEHLADPAAVLAACRARLAPGGLLVLSLPSADGFVFRLGLALRRLGVDGPLERMFQVHYPFPHLYYFGEASVRQLASRYGFSVETMTELPGFRLSGSLRRAQMDRADGAAGGLAVYANAAALAGFALLQPCVAADNIVAILRPTGAASDAAPTRDW